MASGDGLLVRVKPRGGRIDAASMRVVAEAATRFGNGVIELTSRGNLQVRGLSAEGVAPFGEAMVEAGLASADRGAERRRNVVGTALEGVDAGVHPATGAVTAGVEAGLEAGVGLEELPVKFGVMVDGGGVMPPQGRADVKVRLVGDRAEVSGPGGVEVLEVAEAVAGVLRAARASLGGAPSPRPSPGGRGGVGVVGGVAVAGVVPFGSGFAEVWGALADLAERFGDGVLRLTTWRAVVIAGGVGPILRGLEGLGLIVDEGDPRLLVAACPGAPGCASATVRTRVIAAQLRPAAGMTVHVSGCEKGCAQPGAASITLVGREGRFDLVLDGRAGDAPVRRGLSAAEVLAL